MNEQEKIDALQKKATDLQTQINSFEEKSKKLDERNKMQNDTLREISKILFRNHHPFIDKSDFEHFEQSVLCWKEKRSREALTAKIISYCVITFYGITIIFFYLFLKYTHII